MLHAFVRREGGEEGGGRAAVAPGNRLARRIEADVDLLHRGGVIEAVPDVVLAGPLHAHRRADRAGEPGRLDGEVALRLAAEAAAEQRHVDRSEEHTSELQSLMRISYAVF